MSKPEEERDWLAEAVGDDPDKMAAVVAVARTLRLGMERGRAREAVDCPQCGAPVGERCRVDDPWVEADHHTRLMRYRSGRP